MAGGCPFQPGRRGLLAGLAINGLALGGLAAGARAATQPDAREAEPEAGAQDRLTFYGANQAGVTTAQPAAALYAAFDVLVDDREALEQLLRTLSGRAAFLMQGGAVPEIDERMPPLDSGVLGPVVVPDHLSVTIAVGASLFDDRFGLASHRPRHLATMAAFPNDALDAAHCHGDLLLSFNANTAETCIHALRDVMKHTPGMLAIRWKAEGFLPPETLKSPGRDTVRNLLGFKDGTANLDSRDTKLMDRLVWVPAGTEPAWAVGGTYQVVRLIRMLVERWDRTPLGEQQEIFGRDKAEGAPLGSSREHDTPDFASDPDGNAIPLNAHIRLANPRTDATEGSRILRRAYNYSRGLTAAGQLDMGLLFGCFQADLAAGFLAVQGRLNGEPLEEYIKPVGGGYFFVLPGAAEPGDYLGAALMAAA